MTEKALTSVSPTKPSRAFRLIAILSKIMRVSVEPTQPRAVQILCLYGFSAIAIIVATVFGLVNLKSSSTLVGAGELVFAYFAILNILIFRLHSRLEIASSIVLTGAVALIALIVIHGGIAGSGAFWAFVFPITAYLITNQKLGFLWSMFFISTIALIGVLDAKGYIQAYYSPIAIRQLVVSLVTITVLVMIYELIAARSRELVIQQASDLVAASEKLQNEGRSRHTAQEQMAKLLERYNKRNTILEKLKLAMAKLLEDVQHEKFKAEQVSIRDEALVSSIGESILSTDINGIITMANEQAAKLLEIDQKKLVGMVVFDAFQCIDRDGRQLLSDQRIEFSAFVSSKVLNATYTVLRQNHTKFEAAFTASPLIVQGKPQGTVLAIRDRTKEAEVDKAKTEFVSLASHQLRTPLTSINWYLEMILEDKSGQLSEEQREYFEEVYSSSRRMSELVGALLNVSRIDLGSFKVEVKPTDIVEVAENAIAEIDSIIRQHHQTLEKNLAAGMPKFNLDPQLTYIIFQNLLSNAAKYTPDGGKITLSVGLEGEYILITVSDNGYGIPQKQQPKIFTKLFRADNVMKQIPDGTGLGLYIVKAIVEQAGGTISFNSEENKGTTFIVKLPKSGMTTRVGKAITAQS